MWSSLDQSWSDQMKARHHPDHPLQEWIVDSSWTTRTVGWAGFGPMQDSQAAGITMETATPTSTCSAARSRSNLVRMGASK